MWKEKAMMILLSPVKLIYMIANFLRKSTVAEFLFISGTIITTIVLLVRGLLPIDATWKVGILLVYMICILTFQIMFLTYIWNKFHTLMCSLTFKMNVEYNKVRDSLRKKTNNYSMGLDEEAKASVDYFIKKEKGFSEITFR